MLALAPAAAAWPLAVRAQQNTIPVIGFLNGASAQGYAPYVEAFRRGLKQEGFSEGVNVAIEYRWAEGDYGRLPAMAADLVRRQVAVIAANTQAAPVAKAATSSIPIVFFTGYDPVSTGLVTSLGRPGGNATGVTVITGVLAGRHVGLVRELKPGITAIAVLANPGNPNTEFYVKGAEAAARTLGQKMHVVNAATDAEIDAAFATLSSVGAEALLVAPDAFLIGRRDQVVALAARHAIPALYGQRELVDAGGLLSYGASVSDDYRQAGVYAGKILKGANPADLPVLQPAKFELVINLKTAKALGLDIPPTLFAQADEVIE